MIVIVIIGILAGLAIPAIIRAVTTAKEGGYKQEIDSLADAVEKYRNKYGDYPPDGSSWQIMERHFRKIFPQMQQSELDLLNPSITTTAQLNFQGWSGNVWSVNSMSGVIAGVRNDFDQAVVGPAYASTDFKVMDPAEALVFFLGGFSSNPKRPFTGEGGPFVVTTGVAGTAPPASGLTGGQTLQYNPQRSNALFEFRLDRLTLEQVGTSYISNDEEVFLGLPDGKDLLPVYLNRPDIQNSSPIVYFDSRSYVLSKGTNLYTNFYQRASTTATLSPNTERFGAIRPLVSSNLRTPPVLPLASRTNADWVRAYLFLEDKKFQVIGSGIDDIYGGRIAQDMTANISDRIAAYVSMPSGGSNSVTGSPTPAPAANRVYTRLLLQKTSDLYEQSTGQLDNAANCTERTFETSLAAPGS
jgi:type II secretory pathway pseudopilin PulG